jgi:hypothetical protein
MPITGRYSPFGCRSPRTMSRWQGPADTLNVVASRRPPRSSPFPPLHVAAVRGAGMTCGHIHRSAHLFSLGQTSGRKRHTSCDPGHEPRHHGLATST